MKKSLIEKLGKFNPMRPYVWELKITESEFRSLEEDLCGYTPNASHKEDALKMIVYIAEWYKRRYTCKAKKAYQQTFGGTKPDLETAWQTLGIDEQYLYRGENGQKLTLYSTFILSGLAVKFERQKNERSFLRALCRVYNDEDESFDRVVDSNHSIAFKESIAKGHCLRHFLEAIITSKEMADEALPYAKEDIDDSETEVALLIELIREINYEVNKSKFRYEWIVTAIPGDSLMSRKLHLWLNPEEKGKLHQLLRMERLKKWGFAEPENMRYIQFGVRYWNGNAVVKEPDFHHPDLYYRNTGDASIGFICEKENYAVCRNVPVVAFDHVQLIAWQEDGTELSNPVQEDTVDFDAMQLYRLAEGEDDWTSRVSNQKETALLFADKWEIADTSVDKLYERKTFYNKKVGEGIGMSWCYIQTSVTIKDDAETRTYYNRQGYDHIVARRYDDTISYAADGKVMWHHADDEESPETVTPISLIFGKKDIIAYHTESKDGEEDQCQVAEIELCEYKRNGNYTPWTEAEAPAYGYVELRITVKGRPTLFKAFYLPQPITRDLEAKVIRYCNLKKEEQVYDDKANIEAAMRKRQVLEPTVIVNVGTETDRIAIPVYRPVCLKEVIYNDYLLKYAEEAIYELPYILRTHMKVHSYGEHGFQEYDCALLSGLHKLVREKRPHAPNAAWASSAAWEKGDTYQASDIDHNAPDFLLLKMGEKRQSKLNGEDFYFWNYDQDQPLVKMPSKGVTSPQDWGLIFQSNKSNRTGKNLYPLYNDDDDPFKDDGDEHFDKVSLIQCFKMAIEHELYFFTLTPLKNLTEEDFNEQLLRPLLEEYKGNLPQEMRMGLRRFIEEYDFTDKEKYYNIINQYK